MSYSINGFDIDEYNVHAIPEKAKIHTCPKCSHTRKKYKDKCMSVYWDKGIGSCNHCGEMIQLHTFKKKDEIKVYKKPVPKKTANISNAVIGYFKEFRGISESTLVQMKVSEGKRWMPKAKAEIQVIEFNYYLHGELINIKSRGKDKDFILEKDCEKILYNIDSIIGESHAVIVEGEPDALSFHEAGIKNVVSVPNGFNLQGTISLDYLDNYYHVFENMDKIYLAVDQDEAGRAGQKELIRRFGGEKCYLVDFEDCKDANEYLLKYGKERLANTIVLAKQVPLEGVVTVSDVENELKDFWVNGAPKGMVIDLDGFDECASFVFKQYTLLVSAPGSGKSDFIDHISAKLSINYNLKTAVCSTENQPIHFHYDKIVKKILGYRPSKESIDSKSVNDTLNFIKEHYFHIDVDGRYFLEDVLEKFRELVMRKGVRIFVLDPFNKIKLKKTDRKDINAYTEEYHLLLDEFCKKHDCHIFLVLHPIKLSKKEGSDKTFIMPTAYDCKGGGEHFDMSYNIIGMVRDYEHNLVKIRTLKWKFQHLGTSGIDNWFGWNINNGRYTPFDGYFDEKSPNKPQIIYNNRSWLTNKSPPDAEIPKEPEDKIKPASLSEAFGPIDAKSKIALDNKIDDVPF